MKVVPVTVGKNTTKWDVCVTQIDDKLNLGLDFSDACKAMIDLPHRTVTINGEHIRAPLVEGTDIQVSRAVLTKGVILPPNSITSLAVKVNPIPKANYLLEPACSSLPIVISRVVGNGEFCTINVINDSGCFIKLKKGKCVGQVEEIDEIMDCPNEFDKYDVRQVKDNLTQEQLKEVPTHIADLYQQSSENLNSEQRAKLQHILNEFADVFSKHDLDLECFTEVKHQINTGTATPVKQRMRRTPLGFQDVEKQHLEKLLDAK